MQYPQKLGLKMLTYSGDLQGIRTSQFQGQTKAYLQFLDKRPDGSLGFTEVKVPEGMDPAQFRVGQKVSVPVEIKAMKDKIYYAIAKEAQHTGAAKTV